MLRFNEWSKPEDEKEISCYEPLWHDKDERFIKQSGHGGADYITARMFVECIKEGRQPEFPFDVYSATVMSSVAILAHRSMLEGGKPYDVPDFRFEEHRKLYEDDRKTPFYGTDGKLPDIPCCSKPDFKPKDKQIELFEEYMKY